MEGVLKWEMAAKIEFAGANQIAAEVMGTYGGYDTEENGPSQRAYRYLANEKTAKRQGAPSVQLGQSIRFSLKWLNSI